MTLNNEVPLNESRSEPSWNWKPALMLFLFMLIINFLVISNIQTGFLILSGWQFDPISGAITSPGSLVGPWLGSISGELIILFLTFFFVIYVCKSKLKALNFRWPSLKHVLIALGGVVIAYGASYVGGVLQYLLTGPNPNEESYNLLFQTSNAFELIIWILLMMCVVGPCEEIFARAFVQQGLQNSCRSRKISVFIGILIASFFFALVHLNFYEIIPLFFVGFVLGLIYYYTENNAMASAITHGIYNAIIVILLFSPS